MKCTITGRKYSDEKVYLCKSTEFYHYEQIDEKVWVEDFSCLDEARIWLIDNHPDYYLGSSIKLENGDFACFMIPGDTMDEILRDHHDSVEDYLRSERSVAMKNMEWKRRHQ